MHTGSVGVVQKRPANGSCAYHSVEESIDASIETLKNCRSPANQHWLRFRDSRALWVEVGRPRCGSATGAMYGYTRRRQSERMKDGNRFSRAFECSKRIKKVAGFVCLAVACSVCPARLPCNVARSNHPSSDMRLLSAGTAHTHTKKQARKAGRSVHTR